MFSNLDMRKGFAMVVSDMASNFRHLTGWEDGTGAFCCYGKSRRQRQITERPTLQAHEQGDVALPDRRSSVKKL